MAFILLLAVAHAFLTATTFEPEALNFKHIRGRCICVRTRSHAFCASNYLFYLCHMIPAHALLSFLHFASSCRASGEEAISTEVKINVQGNDLIRSKETKKTNSSRSKTNLEKALLLKFRR